MLMLMAPCVYISAADEIKGVALLFSTAQLVLSGVLFVCFVRVANKPK